jgi:hypothetical protein
MRLVMIVLTTVLVLTGCNGLSQVDRHAGSSLAQKGAGTTETVTEQPVFVPAVTSESVATPVGTNGSVAVTTTTRTFMVPAGIVQPDGSVTPVTKRTVTRMTTPAEVEIHGPDVDRKIDVFQNTGVLPTTPSQTVADTLPAITPISGPVSGFGSSEANESTTNAAGTNAPWYTRLWRGFLAWFWTIVVVLIVVNLAAVVMWFIPVTKPVAQAIWGFETVGWTWLWGKAKAAEASLAVTASALGKTVKNIEAGAVAGTVKGPFFQAQSAALNGTAADPTTEKGVVDALRPADATNIVTAGAVDAVTAPPAVKL